MRYTLLIWIWLCISGCAATTPDSRLNLPYSEKIDIIHAYEAINFVPVDKGERDIVLFFKSAPSEVLQRYHTFDTRIVHLSNVLYNSLNHRRSAAHARKYIRQKLEQNHFNHTGGAMSQAGIAVTLSSYQKIPGRNIEELLMVVFDRKKARELSAATPDLKGYELIKQTALWVGVVRHAPARQADISTQTHTMQDEDFIRMVDLMFEGFMNDSNYVPLN